MGRDRHGRSTQGRERELEGERQRSVDVLARSESGRGSVPRLGPFVFEAPSKAGQGVPSSTQQESQEGPSWFEETRQAAEQTTKPKSNYVDRQDLYTDNWDGDTYTGGGLNILTVLVGLGLGVPLVGLVFAYLTWGELWGT